MIVSSSATASAGSTAAASWPIRCSACRVVICWPGWGRLTPPARLSRVSDRVVETIALIVMITAEMPRMVLGLRRMDANAPSRISPTPSGRSGITPGLGADAPYRGPGPGWPAGGPYPAWPYPGWPLPGWPGPCP